MSGALLVRALAEPASAAALDDAGWTALLTAARAEQLLASLGHRLGGLPIPGRAAAILADARASGEVQRTHALWEAEMARRALAPLGVPIVLLKGTAYVAAGLAAGVGRSIGDLDILVPRAALGMVEQALLAAGWEWVKPDDYDDDYYRRWMHELPPLIHRTRDRMIDVHHSILPLTARPRPDADALIADAVPLGNGLSVLSPADRIVHAAAHLLADGDLAGGLRNLWDIDRLLREVSTNSHEFTVELRERARRHGLLPAVARALRLAHGIYATPIDAGLAGRRRLSDRSFNRCLLVRDGWGGQRRPVTRFAFYVRSHMLRMPPHLLARHLAVKWWARRAG